MPDSPPAANGPPSRIPRWRLIAFAAIALVMTGLAAFVVVQARRDLPSAQAAALPAASPVASSASGWSHGAFDVVFRNLALAPEQDFGKVAFASIADGTDTGARTIEPLRCIRVHFASGRGLCLELEATGSQRTILHVLDDALRSVWSTQLTGLPSRARVSPDGRFGAVTLFVTGHSYTDVDMSTLTAIVDLETPAIVADLEQFQALRDGAPFAAADFNYWGVTFAADANRFFATLATAGTTWLVEGDLKAKEVRTLRENVECPSLSPDGKRLAFKKRIEGRGQWRLHTLDVATLTEHILPGETRSIDDQVEWLDDGHILYKHGPSVYALDVADGTPPTVLLERASSPAVVRP